jgi:hypothetical protein
MTGRYRLIDPLPSEYGTVDLQCAYGPDSSFNLRTHFKPLINRTKETSFATIAQSGKNLRGREGEKVRYNYLLRQKDSMDLLLLSV